MLGIAEIFFSKHCFKIFLLLHTLSVKKGGKGFRKFPFFPIFENKYFLSMTAQSYMYNFVNIFAEIK